MAMIIQCFQVAAAVVTMVVVMMNDTQVKGQENSGYSVAIHSFKLVRNVLPQALPIHVLPTVVSESHHIFHS